MKVLFISLLTGKNERDIFPVGYGYVMGYVEKRGHECEVLLPKASFMTNDDIAHHLRETDASVIGLGGMYSDLFRAVELSELVRNVRPDLKIVIGGPMATYSPELAMRKTGADFGICGDGEIAMLRLLDGLDKGVVPDDLPGLVRWDGDTVATNGYAEQVDMDDVEFPDWNKFPMEYFLHLARNQTLGQMFSGDYRGSFSWVFSRGCIGRCNFCSPGGRPRFMSVGKLVDIVEHLCRTYNLRGFGFADNIIAPNKSYVLDLCSEFIKRGLYDVRFSGNLRANQVDPEVAATLKSAGFVSMGMGIESANNELLKKMRKNVTVEEIDRAITAYKDVGITVLLSCMFGQPGETLDDCVNTLRMFMKASDVILPSYNMHFFSPLYTYPGAPIYDWAKDNGYIESDEAFYDDFFIKGKQGYVNYTDYSDELHMEFVHIGRMLNDWRNHKNQKAHLESQLLSKYDEMKEQSGLREPILAGVLVREEIVEALGTLALEGRKVVLYGIADVAEMVADHFAERGLGIVSACDGYESKWGMDFRGHTVCGIVDVPPDSFDTILVCTKSVSSDEQIVSRLQEVGLTKTQRIIRLFTMIQKRKHLRQVAGSVRCDVDAQALQSMRKVLRDIL